MNAKPNRHRALAWPMVVVAGASLALAACSSSTKTASTASPSTVAPAAARASGSNASVTLSTANIPGVGMVLVDGNGRTLYILTSENGGKVNCTATGGCTKIWPAVVLPSGMSHGIAGHGVKATLLGTVRSPAGDVRLTYGGWPLYTFIDDKAPGSARGQNFRDVYGLWLALSPSGHPITPAASTPTTAMAPEATSPATAATTPSTAASPPPTAAPTTAAPTTAAPTTAAPTTTVPQTGGGGF